MHEENNKEVVHPTTSKKNISISKAIIIAGVIIALAILLTQSSVGREQALIDATAQIAGGGGSGSGLLNGVTSDDFSRGAKNPKITIVEFSDFGCSFCSSFHPTLRDIINKYPDDIAWVYRHLPFRNNEAALAAECVGQELGDEAFWKYSDKLFANYPDITNDLMVSEAIGLGFKNEKDFWACQSSENVAKGVQADAAEARLIGATGTPHSIILTKDGRTFPLRGASSFEQVDQIVSVLLNQ